MSRKVLQPEEFLKKILSQEAGARLAYKACYMSWVDGIVTDPRLMMISLDDHMVHRGDGVFEAVKFENGKAFLLKEHLDRLEKSAEMIFLKMPFSRDKMEELIQEVFEASGLKTAMLRIFVSRGGGSFGPSPYDSKKSELSLVMTEFKPIPEEKYKQGVKVGKSKIPPKSDFWARIKSCNYLPNVLMKKESVDRGLDFTVSFDENGYLCESSTENMIIVDKNGRLCRPRLDRILKGCTMIFAMEEAVKAGVVKESIECDITEADIRQAREVLMVGTTLGVLPVSQFEDQKYEIGTVGGVGTWYILRNAAS